MSIVYEQEVLLTTEQLAARWQANSSHLRYWRMQREAGDKAAGPPYVKLGRNVRYRMADILAYEEGNLT